MNKSKYEKIKTEVRFWIKTIERLLLEEFLIKISLIGILILLGYYLASNGDKKATNSLDLTEVESISKKAWYVYITRKFGFKECYYINSENEYEMCYCYDGKSHPMTNTPVYKLTSEIAYQIGMQTFERGFLPGVDQDIWTKDGYPLVYYHYFNGRYECFTAPGYHPDLGVELLPASPEVAHEWKRLIELKHFHRFVLDEESHWAVTRDPMAPDYYDRLINN